MINVIVGVGKNTRNVVVNKYYGVVSMIKINLNKYL